MALIKSCLAGGGLDIGEPFNINSDASFNAVVGKHYAVASVGVINGFTGANAIVQQAGGNAALAIIEATATTVTISNNSSGTNINTIVSLD